MTEEVKETVLPEEETGASETLPTNNDEVKEESNEQPEVVASDEQEDNNQASEEPMEEGSPPENVIENEGDTLTTNPEDDSHVENGDLESDEVKADDSTSVQQDSSKEDDKHKPADTLTKSTIHSKQTGPSDSGHHMEPISEEAEGDKPHVDQDENGIDSFNPPERLETMSPTDNARDNTDSQVVMQNDTEATRFTDADEFEESVKVPDRESLIEFYQQAMKDREGLVQENTTLQNKLAEYFRRKRNEEGGAAAATARGNQEVDRSVSDLEQRYLSFMTNLEELQNRQRESKESYETEIAAIKEQCAIEEAKLDRVSSEFVEKRRQIAAKAINSRTGKPLQRDEIETFIQNEQKKDQEVKGVRLENIKLKNRLQKREKQLKQKEELAEGLHLIDFEQLKIENQTYNEKIEERNEELSKLRKKITNTVEVLTHLKEKLQYIQQENHQLNLNLRELDVEVAQKRDALTKVKQNRDSLRNENGELSRKCGLLGNETLLRDYEEKYSESSDLKTRLADLKSRHTELSMKCTGYKKKIEQARSGIMIQ